MQPTPTPLRRWWPLALGAAVALGAAAVGLGVGSTRGPRPEPAARRPNFLVIDIDTLSIGHVGTTRDGRPVTPNIDALAARGVTFTQMVTQAGWTMPSVHSLLTGRMPLPAEIGRQGGIGWTERGARDLAEILGLYGYHTAAAWGGTVAGPARERETGSFAETLGGQSLPDPAVERWLAGPPPEPFLLFLHEIDLHQPQSFVGTPVDERCTGASYERTFRDLRLEQDAETARERTVGCYDALLHRYDERVGRMLTTLDDQDLSDHTVVIVLSDHGEDLFVHAFGDHNLLYDTVLRVPLVIADPASPRRGAVEPTTVQTVDIAPTLLARAGVPVDVEMDGQSLLPLLGLDGPPYAERPVTSLNSACSVSLRDDGYKLIVSSRHATAFELERDRANPPRRMPVEDLLDQPWMSGFTLPDCLLPSPRRKAAGQRPPRDHDGSGLVVELYDLAADPDELTDIAAQRPDVLQTMLPTLLRWREEREQAAAGAPKHAMSAEAEKALRDQGYWQNVEVGSTAAPEPPAP